MPKNKKQILRLAFIVGELKKNQCLNAEQIVRKISMGLGGKYDIPECSKKTIERDIAVLRKNFNAKNNL